MKIGLIINPIAGMGGAVGLKGTDNFTEKAIEMGARPKAEKNTLRALKEIELECLKKSEFFTGSGSMGEEVLKSLNLPCQTVDLNKNTLTDYSSLDTKNVCKFCLENCVDIIVFAGGDGTARDILDVSKGKIAVIGIPTGVKMQSAVFSMKPNLAGNLLNDWLNYKITNTKEMEVMDLNEQAYRENKITSTLYGYLPVAYDKKRNQNKKSASALTDEANQKAIAFDFIDNMKEDIFYIIGPGTTTKSIFDALNEKKTLLGFDILFNGKAYKYDVNEEDILALIAEKNAINIRIVLTPIGGQGMLLGRGNQQISIDVLNVVSQEQLIILATKNKLASLQNRPLFIDSGDDEIDKKMQGYYSITTSYKEKTIYKVI